MYNIYAHTTYLYRIVNVICVFARAYGRTYPSVYTYTVCFVREKTSENADKTKDVSTLYDTQLLRAIQNTTAYTSVLRNRRFFLAKTSTGYSFKTFLVVYKLKVIKCTYFMIQCYRTYARVCGCVGIQVFLGRDVHKILRHWRRTAFGFYRLRAACADYANTIVTVELNNSYNPSVRFFFFFVFLRLLLFAETRPVRIYGHDGENTAGKISTAIRV